MTAAHPAGVDVAMRPVGPTGPSCQCVAKHRPQPREEEIHHIVPQGAPFGGPDVASNRVPLCPTTHSNVHMLIRLQLKARKAGTTAGKVVNRYSPFVRDLADRAMDALG